MYRLKFLNLIVLLAIYENRIAGIPPTQKDLFGEPTDYNGLINNLMYEIYLLDDEGNSNDPRFGKKLKSANMFYNVIRQLREAGLLVDEEGSRYIMTDFGEEVAEEIQHHLKEYQHYSELPFGAIVDGYEVKYRYIKEL